VARTVGFEEFARLLSVFPHLYGIDERRGRISALPMTTLATTSYTNLVASRVAITAHDRRGDASWA
jgi:hypothetical protein